MLINKSNVNCIDLSETGRYFHLFAMCHSNVTHVFKGIGLVGNGQIYEDNILTDLLEVDEDEITRGYMKLEEQGFIVTSKIFDNRRSIATVGFDYFYHPVSCISNYDNRFDEIFGELNDIIINSKWDVSKIKNSSWFPFYLDIHRHHMWDNAITFDESK